MATFLVMGAGGFIGQHLVNKFLIKNRSVIAIGHGVDELKNRDKLTTISGEINESLLDKIDKPDYIYFLLGGSSVASSMNEPVIDFEKTFQPLTIIIEKLKSEWSECRLIFISSAAVYGRNASQSTSTKTVCKPLSVYGLHKFLAEQYIEFHKINFNIKAKIIRPFSIYGPGLRKQLIWDALCKIKNNQHEYFGSGLEERDWLHVSDFVDLLIDMAAHFEAYPNVINAGYGRGTKIKEITSLLYQINNSKLHPEFANKSKEGDPQHLVCDPNEQFFMTKFECKSLKQNLLDVSLWFDELYFSSK